MWTRVLRAFSFYYSVVYRQRVMVRVDRVGKLFRLRKS